MRRSSMLSAVHQKYGHAQIAALVLALLAPVALLAAGEPQTLAVNDAVQVPAEVPALRVYLDVLDAAGEELDELAPAELAATLGEEALALGRLAPFAPATGTGEGVGYVLLVDVSASLNAAQFDQIRGALRTWIAELGPEDRAAILAFGSESRVLVDFTADRDRLSAALAALGPTDAETLLHRALLDALDLGRRRDPELPARRAAVVLTDGLDEGSGLSVDDVLATLRDSSMPIYAIGYSQLPEPRRRTNLDVLRRFASNSGGAFFEADRTRIAEAYTAIHQAIDRVWVADFTCTACRTDGALYRLQLTLRRGGRVLTAGKDVRMLPQPDGARTAPGAAASGADAGTASAGGTEETASGVLGPAAAPDAGRVRFWLYLALAAAVAALLAWLAGRLARRRQPEAAVGPAPAPPPPLPAPPAAPGVVSRAATAAANELFPGATLARERPRRVRLIVLRGSRRGREYALTLEASAVVGSRSTCDLVLAEETDIAARQFELAQRDRRVMIRNLAGAASPTLLNGLALTDWEPVKSNDLVGTGGTILRVVYH